MTITELIHNLIILQQGQGRKEEHLAMVDMLEARVWGVQG